MVTKQLASLATACLLAFSLAACGGGGDKQADTSPSPSMTSSVDQTARNSPQKSPLVLATEGSSPIVEVSQAPTPEPTPKEADTLDTSLPIDQQAIFVLKQARLLDADKISTYTNEGELWIDMGVTETASRDTAYTAIWEGLTNLSSLSFDGIHQLCLNVTIPLMNNKSGEIEDVKIVIAWFASDTINKTDWASFPIDDMPNIAESWMETAAMEIIR